MAPDSNGANLGGGSLLSDSNEDQTRSINNFADNSYEEDPSYGSFEESDGQDETTKKSNVAVPVVPLKKGKEASGVARGLRNDTDQSLREFKDIERRVSSIGQEEHSDQNLKKEFGVVRSKIQFFNSKNRNSQGDHQKGEFSS